MKRAFERIPEEKSSRLLWNVTMLRVSINLPDLAIRSDVLDEDCTLLPLLVDLTDGLKLLLSSEYPDALVERIP